MTEKPETGSADYWRRKAQERQAIIFMLERRLRQARHQLATLQATEPQETSK